MLGGEATAPWDAGGDAIFKELSVIPQQNWLKKIHQGKPEMTLLECGELNQEVVCVQKAY